MNKKYLLIIAITLFNLLFFCGMTLFNGYILGGIRFPNELAGNVFLWVFGSLIYVGCLIMPLLSAWFVHRRDIGYGKILLLNSLPYVAQGIALGLYQIFGEIYGYICC